MYNKLTFFNSLDELTRDLFESSKPTLSLDYDVHKTEDGAYHIFEVPGFVIFPKVIIRVASYHIAIPPLF